MVSEDRIDRCGCSASFGSIDLASLPAFAPNAKALDCKALCDMPYDADDQIMTDRKERGLFRQTTEQ
jgi:hypothetical protein